MLQQLMGSVAKRPTGPVDENYLDAHLYGEEGDVVAPLLGATFDDYMAEHAPFRKSKDFKDQVAANFNEMLTANTLHENDMVTAITKAHGLKWIEYIRTPKVFPARAIPKAVTIAAKLAHMRHFFQWCVSQDFLKDNPFRDVRLHVRQVSASRTKKEPLSDAELVKVFESINRFVETDRVPSNYPSKDKRTEFIHLCRMLAFTGARLTEMLQLDTKDVSEVDGIWIANLETHGDDGKRLKNAPSHRKVPLHSQLLTLFLPWFQSRSTEKVFPLLHIEGSKAASRWFSYQLKRAGVKRPQNSLHSLRHTVTVKLTLARTHPPLQNRFLGHVIAKGVEGSSYQWTVQYPVKELSEAIEAVKFPML